MHILEQLLNVGVNSLEIFSKMDPADIENGWIDEGYNSKNYLEPELQTLIYKIFMHP